MKRVICLAAIISVCLVSCSSTSSSSSDVENRTPKVTESETARTTSEENTEKKTETETEIPPASTTEPVTEPEINDLILETHDIQIYYQGVEKNVIKFHIKNPSDKLPVHAWIQDVSVNGIFLENFGYELYAPNYGDNITNAALPLEELQSQDISRINELKFTLLVNLGDQTVYSDKDKITITR